MRFSVIALASFFALAVASPGFQKRTDDDPSMNTTSTLTTSVVMTTASYGTGHETAIPSSTGMFNNGTSTSTVETTTSASSAVPHRTTATTSLPSTSTSSAGAAPTSVWAHMDTGSALAGVVGILGFAMAL